MSIASKVWIDGKIVPLSNAKIFPFNQGLNYGACIYEGIRFYSLKKGSAIFRLEDHLHRFYYSASVLRMNLKVNQIQLKEAIIATIKANSLKSGYIRPMAFYSDSKMGINILSGNITIMILVWPWEEGKEPKQVRLKIATLKRISKESVDLKAKISGYYASSLLGFIEAREAGFDEPLFLDSQGFIAEGAVNNIFFVKNNTLYTPKKGNILEGITRDSIIKIVPALGMKVFEKNILPNFAKSADEIFLTGTGIELEKVIEISKIYAKKSGSWDVTDKLSSFYCQITKGEIKEFKNWLTIINS